METYTGNARCIVVQLPAVHPLEHQYVIQTELGESLRKWLKMIKHATGAGGVIAATKHVVSIFLNSRLHQRERFITRVVAVG